MRVNHCRIYIRQLLDALNTFENENDKIRTGRLVCDLVFHTDILYDQYGKYDKEFNSYFEQVVNKLYEKYPNEFQLHMNELEIFKQDVIYDDDDGVDGVVD